MDPKSDDAAFLALLGSFFVALFYRSVTQLFGTMTQTCFYWMYVFASLRIPTVSLIFDRLPLITDRLRYVPAHVPTFVRLRSPKAPIL